MILYGLPVLYAAFLWWFSTCAILYLDGLSPRSFPWSMGAATLLMAGALGALPLTGGDISPFGAYAGFAIGLVAWGWLEMGYYMGFMLGPRRQASPESCTGWQHFGNAVATTLYHELAALGLLGVIATLTWGMPNRIAFWTFVILWAMQLSAKLNVFLGVPNLAENFLPAHLAFLRSFMTRRPMNLFFPVSLTASTILATLLIVAATSASSDAAAIGSTMLASLMVLAVVEHWVLVVPLPVDRLWTWSLGSRARLPTDGPAAAAGTSHARKRAEPSLTHVLPPPERERFTLGASVLPNR